MARDASGKMRKTQVGLSRPTSILDMQRLYRRNAELSSTMDAFWVRKGWFELNESGDLKLTQAQWDKNTSIEAFQHLVRKVLKPFDPRDITSRLLLDHGLGWPMMILFHSDTHLIASSSFPEMNILPWEMKSTKKNFFKPRENRIDAIRWLTETKLNKDPRALTIYDFTENRLRGLLRAYYSDSPYLAVKDAYPELNITYSDMHRTPRQIHNHPEILIDEIRTAVESTGKPGREIRRKELNVSKPVRTHFGPNLFDILFAAGAVTEEDRAYMEARNNRRKIIKETARD